MLLALAMCLALLPATAFAAGDISGSCGSNLTYRFDSATGTLTISGSGEMEKNTYYGLRGISPAGPVYGYYYRWPWESDADFDGSDVITSVVIEEGVTSIGERAFERNKNLTHVTIPSSVTTIGSYAFHECSALISVDIKGSGLTSIGNRAFDDCSSLTGLDIPSSVTSIGDSAFGHCSSLTSVTIPNGVTHLDSRNFTGCDSLTRVTIPSSITSITPTIFNGCGELTDIYYQGTAAQWKAIDGSDAFERWGFTIHFSDVPDVAVSASPAALTFQMEEDGVSYPQWVTAKNEGVVDITLVQPTAKHFDISMESTSVSAGRSVRFSMQPKSGLSAGTYSETITVKTSDGQGTTSVDVTLTVTEKPAPLPFNDVPEFWYRPVAWAVEKKITIGTTATTFSPNNSCTNGQILTFLWRATGEPASSATLPFATTGREYYLGAAKWAYEKGMIGADFNANAPCTRADVVNYIWRAAGQGAASYDGRFTDVPTSSPYATAVAWAVENGVTTGATDTTFNPNGVCNRAQIVTFLYRYFGE